MCLVCILATVLGAPFSEGGAVLYIECNLALSEKLIAQKEMVITSALVWRKRSGALDCGLLAMAASDDDFPRWTDCRSAV